MTPEQTQACAALVVIGRLVKNHGLTAEEAATALAQHRRQETGPHTDLVAAEARAFLAEALGPLRAALRQIAQTLAPAVKAASEAMAELHRALQTTHTGRARRDRPAWTSPYGPAHRRRR
ncbi:hypothetical protein ACFT54_09815 [Streptomyces cinereoruber]|uniref:hypothetical protein n=1 Tax=Streptomyces cinereoruber TaxID=67260 RepID=UPI00362EDE29